MSFVFYDGDRIGEKFKQAYLADDWGGIAELSAKLLGIHLRITHEAAKLPATLIEYGGDEGLYETSLAPTLINVILKSWREADLDVSVGVGESIAKAYRSCQAMKQLKGG